MRDIATYEVNLSDELGLRSIFMKMYKMVNDTKNKIDKLCLGDGSWISNNLSKKLMSQFEDTRTAQQLRAPAMDLVVHAPL